MFARIATLLPLAFLVSASSIKARDNNCSSGPVQCCNQVQESNLVDQNLLQNALSALNLNLDAIVPIGLTCSSATVIGATGGTKCSSQTVCCDHVDQNSAVGINCSPTNVQIL